MLAAPRTRHLSMLSAWILTRVLAVALLVAFEASMGASGDVVYFGRALSDVGRDGLAMTLVEYPIPAVALLELPG